MKVKHDVARTSQSCLCFSSKRFLYDARNKEYYGKCISLREKLILRKLFRAVYDDITQTLLGSNAKRKSSENLRLAEEMIKVAKNRLISLALKIVNIDKPEDSKTLSDCCSFCRYDSTIPLCEHDRRLHRHGGVYTCRENSGCRVVSAKRVGKRQVKRIWSDICTYKFNNSKEKEWTTRMEHILDRNYVTVCDYPFNYKTFNENKTTFFKNYTDDRQTSLIDKISNKNLPTFKIFNPSSRAYKIDTGKTPFKSIENGKNESIYILKQYHSITHRPPYNFVANPRISLNKLSTQSYNIKHRFDKDATGDTNYETVTNIQPIVKRNDDKYDTNLIRLALRRCLSMLTIKPHHYQLDVITSSKTAAKTLRLVIRTPLSSQSKSVNERSKKIKKTKKNNAKVRHRFCKKLNILNSYLNLSGRGSKDHSENYLHIRNNLLTREVKEIKLNRNVFCVENTPEMFMNSERQSFRSKKSKSPAAKFYLDANNEAQEIKKLPEECSLSYLFVSHYSTDCKPEIDEIGSTCQNIIDQKPQVLSNECKPVFNGCIPHESLVSTNEIDQKEHRTSDCKKLGTHRSEPKSTNRVTHRHTKYTETANAQTSLTTEINKISIDSKLNQALQVNSSLIFNIEFYEKTSPFLHDAYICQCGRQYRGARFQTIEAHREREGPREEHGKTLDTDISYEKNFCIVSDPQSSFCTSKLHNIRRNILGTTEKEVKREISRKRIVSKKTQLKSFNQDNDIRRQDFGFVTDISCNRSIPCISNEEKIATDFIMKSKRIIQRNKSTQTFSSAFMNKSRQTKIRSSKQAACSEIMNIEFSQNRKIRHTYVPNGKPYLIDDVSNKYKHSYSPIALRRAVEFETSFSSFSSIIGATATSTSDSYQSLPSAKYNKYKQNTSHTVGSIYESSFYAFNINVENTRTDTRETKLERKKRLAEAKTNGVTSDTDPNAQESVPPRHLTNRPNFLAGKHSKVVLIGSNISFDVQFSKTVPGRDFISERKQDKSTVSAKDVTEGEKKKQDIGAAFMQTNSNVTVNQGTHTVKNKKGRNLVSQSHADMQHVGINTKRCFCTLKLHKVGRVYREKGISAKLSKPKPNVLKETGTVTKEINQNAAVVEVDIEPYKTESGTDPKESLKRSKNRKNQITSVGAPIAPEQKNYTPSTIEPGKTKDISSKQACRIKSNFSFSIEFVKYTPGEENIAVEEKPKRFDLINRWFRPKNLKKKYKTVFQNIVCKCDVIQNIICKCDVKKYLNIQNQNSNKSVQSNVKYRQDGIKKMKEVGINSKNDMGTAIQSKHMKEVTTTTQSKKDKKRKNVNKLVKYRLEDLDPYECEPGTCIPGECDPNACFEIIKKRGMGTSVGTDLKSKQANEGTTTHNKKGKKQKTVNAKSVGDSGIQSKRAHGSLVPSKSDAILKRCFCTANLHGIELPLAHSKSKKVKQKQTKITTEEGHSQSSQVIPSKTGAILKRCFCTAKLHGIELPQALSKSKKVKQKGTKKKTKEGHSQSSQTGNRDFNLLNLEPYECEPGVCVPGKCDPGICYERIKRRNGIKNISTQSNHESKSVKAGKHTADHTSKSVKAGKHKADDASKSVKAGKDKADHDRKSLKSGKHTVASLQKTAKSEKYQEEKISTYPSKSVVRIGSNFEFKIGFSRQISGIGGDGPDNTKPITKRNMVSGTEVAAKPKTKKPNMVPATAPAKPKTKAKGGMVRGIS